MASPTQNQPQPQQKTQKRALPDSAKQVKSKQSTKQYLENIQKAIKALPGLPLGDVLSLLEVAKELIQAGTEQIGEGMRSATDIANSLTKQIDSFKETNKPSPQTKSLNPAFNQTSIMSMNPQYAPQSKMSAPAMQSQIGQNPLPDGQIRLDIPAIQHWDGQEEDGLVSHTAQNLPSSNLLPNAVSSSKPDLEGEAEKVRGELNEILSRSFAQTQDAS